MSIKTKMCRYYLNNKCKYMKTPKSCPYAHGEEDINKIICKYKNKCINLNCRYYHEKPINTFINNKIVVNKKSKHNNFYINEDSKINSIELPISGLDINSIKIYNKHDPKKNANIKIIKNDNPINNNRKDFSSELDKLLNVVDSYYINIINNKNIEIRDIIVKNNFKLNNQIEISMKKKYVSVDDICSCKKDIVEKIPKNNKLKLYEKYISLYNLFINKKYKNLDFKSIRKYSLDKNIYKLKERSFKVFKYVEFIKINNIKNNYLPISKIIKLNF